MRGALLLLAALAWGCGEDFPSRSLVEDYRLIGIVADQPEAPPDGQVTLRAIDLDPTGAPTTYTWSLCRWSFGAIEGYACVDPAFETPLAATDGRVTIDFGPAGVDFRRFYAEHGPFADATGAPLSLSDGVDVYVRLLAGPADAPVHAIKRVRLRDGGTPNRNPALGALSVEPAGADVVLRLAVEPAAAQPFVDPVDGAPRSEALWFTWYTTAGSLDPPVTAVPHTRLRLPDGAGPARVMVAARDGRGGLTVAEVEVQPQR